MTPGDVLLIRTCWRRVLIEVDAHSSGPGVGCVVHGDLGASAVLVDGDEVGIIDWDEARVDVPLFDAAGLPGTPSRPVGVDGRTVRLVALAWEAATCWGRSAATHAGVMAELRAVAPG